MLSKRVSSSKSKQCQNLEVYSPAVKDPDPGLAVDSSTTAITTLTDKVIGELKEAFEKLVALVPQLRLTNSYEYEHVLSDILHDLFNKDDVAIRGFIQAIINSMDKTIISEYIDSIIKHEAKELESESPFRVALINHHCKWMDKVLHTGPDVYKANVPRRIELATLKSALDANRFQFKGSNKPLKLFPDDELINVVESIIANGKTFTTELCGVPIASSLSFDDFLLELKEINLQRLEGKLKAHSPTIIGSKKNLTGILRGLLIQQDKILQTPSYQKIEHALSLAQQRLTERNLIATHIEEEAKLNTKIRDLETQLAKANERTEALELVDQQRKQLLRMNNRLRQENAYLNRQMIQMAQETDKEEVLTIVKDTLTEKPRYTELKTFSLFQNENQDLESGATDQLYTQSSSAITLGDTHYVRQGLLENTDTPFYLFGLNRLQAYLLLKKNILQVRENMKFFWRDIPIANVDFVKSISADYANLKHCIEDYNVAKQKKVPDLAQYARKLEPYMYDLALLLAYIDYDVNQGLLNGGWCHPALLTALADILDIHLSFYVIDEHGKMTIHPDFQGYEIMPATQHLELLMTQGYRFERVVPSVTLSSKPQHNGYQTEEGACSSTQNLNMGYFA